MGGGDSGLEEDEEEGDIGLRASGGSGGFNLTSCGISRLSSDDDICFDSSIVTELLSLFSFTVVTFFNSESYRVMTDTEPHLISKYIRDKTGQFRHWTVRSARWDGTEKGIPMQAILKAPVQSVFYCWHDLCCGNSHPPGCCLFQEYKLTLLNFRAC